MNIIALIPARGGSKRIPGKNIRLLNGHPLIAYSIQSAKDSGIFDRIYVSSDSEEIGKIAEFYGVKWIKRPNEFSTDNSPDLEWINHAFLDAHVWWEIQSFAIIRPTNPFRTGETIERAWRIWNKKTCMKAIEKVNQHPGKMWTSKNKVFIKSFLPGYSHLGPTQVLQDVYIQNATLEFRPFHKANGEDKYYQPFFTQGYEGFDLNDETDWILAEALIEKGLAKLPEIEKEPYASQIKL